LCGGGKSSPEWPHDQRGIGDLLAQEQIGRSGLAPHRNLSAREFQVFLKLAKGDTARDIAGTLSLSAKTVSTCRTRLMEMMDLNSNSDLTCYALQHSLIA
jgi:two-component system, NarL family, invasion response regulator UvrY